MDAVDTYLGLCAVCMFLGLLLDEAGLPYMEIIFWGAGAVFALLACYSAAAGAGKHRKKRKRR